MTDQNSLPNLSSNVFIDAHCHLADPRFDGFRDSVLARAKAAGIAFFIQGGVGPDDWQRQRRLSDGSWFLSFGLHPWFVAQHDEAMCREALRLLPEYLPEGIGLGECGLDYGPNQPKASYQRQQSFFSQQLELAKQWDKPLILHAVRSHGEMLARIREVNRHWRGIVHGFTGSYEVAKAYLELGFSISVGGGITRKGYQKLKNAVSRIPMNRLVVESDAPDMAPTDWEHPLNEPSSLWLTAEAIGRYQNLPSQEVLSQSRRNLCRIFDLEC